MTKQEALFWQLYECKNEQEVDKLIRQRPEIFADSNWSPLGGNTDFFGVVENQQSNPVAALVEKLTNAMDAVLMRRCHEEGIDPKSEGAPKSIEEAIHRFFPQHKNWDLRDPRSEQARSIQLLADGSRQDTSIIIYDDGEGQHPEQFENTFLSLLRGNKRRIPFVHGKYNMGGTGAIVFCGKKRYQLIASKRCDDKGLFGFTLIRERPRLEETYDAGSEYQYLKVNGGIPSFDIDELDLGLHRRLFRTGTIIKLYSYDVPGSLRHFIRGLSPSVNQFLFQPALPYFIVENKRRYKRTHDGYALVNYGLGERLKESKYLESTFSEAISDRRFGNLKVSVYVFKARIEDKTAEETKKTVRNIFFNNKMQVLFSISGQVHGHYTSEFISNTLKFQLLKDYLLIHVDCTGMNYAFRRELFMGSRDRLKRSKAAAELRKKLGDSLKIGQLLDIFKARKDRGGHDSADSEELLKRIAEDLPLDKDMRDLIKQTMELDEPGDKPKPKPRPPKPPQPTVPVDLKRYPSFFRVKTKRKESEPVIAIPRGGSKTMQLESDVQDDYFDRAKDPGDLEFAILTYRPNDASGGDQKGTVNSVSDILSVNKQSPKDGDIRVVFEPTADLQVGDEIEMRADLRSIDEPDGALSVIFWVSIVKPNKPPKPAPPPPEEEKLGLPQPVLVYAKSEEGEGRKTWDELNNKGITMEYGVVMYPDVDEEDKLEKIYINMDSGVFKDYFKYKYRNPSGEQRQLAERQYISRVYYHTLFLYVISLKRNFTVRQLNGHDVYDPVNLTDYLMDVFNNHYAKFLLSFESSAIIDALE